MAQNIDLYKTLTLIQGGADTFVEGSLSTGIIPEDGMAWRINKVEAQYQAGQLILLSADNYVMISICRDTKTTIVGFNDNDCVMIFGKANALTTSGTYQSDLVQTIVPPDNTLFVEPEIYMQLGSAGTGQAMVVNVRIHYELVKVSEIDILRLLQNS